MKQLLKTVKSSIEEMSTLSVALRQEGKSMTIPASKELIHQMRITGLRKDLREMYLIQNILKERAYETCEGIVKRNADWSKIYKRMVNMGLKEHLENNVNKLASDGYTLLVNFVERNNHDRNMV